MRKHFFIYLLSLASLSAALGQDSGYRQDLADLLNRNAVSNYGNGQLNVYNQDFSKNTFIFKEWSYAQVNFKDGKTYDSLMLNYDDEENVLLVTLSLGTDPFSLRSVDINSFSFYSSPDNPFLGLKNTVFEEVVKPFAFYEQVFNNEEKELTVLKSYLKKFRDVEQQVSYAAVKDDGGKYDLYSRYYIKQGNGKYERVTLGKKTIQGLIGKGKMKEAQRLLKSKKLKWGDPQALITVIEALM